ncbi:hypothetical protein B6U81_05225 [Thermoplasmatales archaeon ex4484_30]|nr:MAG: hypothetical protein B6U81_05225 [Thermoplasmatales archaeon ex4484_30]
MANGKYLDYISIFFHGVIAVIKVIIYNHVKRVFYKEVGRGWEMEVVKNSVWQLPLPELPPC